MDDRVDDEAAILALLHANRIAYWTQDFDAWQRCFVHADYTTRSGTFGAAGIFVRKGWDELAQRFGRDHPGRRDSFAYETRILNLRVRISGDMAWAVFEQQYPGVYDEAHVGIALVHEMRVLERHDGQWRIALHVFLDSAAGTVGARLFYLEPDGKVVWTSPAATETLADSDDLAIRNGHLRFRSARVDARFRTALEQLARQDDGLQSRSTSLPIVVEAGEGVPASVYWLAVDRGLIKLSFGSGTLSAERLALAAAIYGLSPAQEQVAGLVAEGMSLVEIAGRMAITPNTARTHRNRIFDKTGVRTQPALVRLLLLAVAPH